ncbi:GNAT family N-acetyltransferase [Thalassotalea fusca]
MQITPSNRLSYRLVTRDDKQDLFDLDQDPAVMEHLNGGKPTTMEEIENIWIPRMEKYATPEKGWGIWHVTLTDTGEFLGFILMRPMGFFEGKPDEQDLETGWRFFQHTWGKGYATEAAKHLMTEIAKTQDIKSFSAIAVKENVASIAVMKKLGMTFIKEAINDDPLFEGELVVYYRVNV